MAKKNKGGKPGYYTYREVVESLAYRTLPAVSKALYHDLRKRYRGNNGNINAALSELKYDGWRSSATLAKHLKLLQEHRLLVKTREGGFRSGSLKTCCLYAFTDLPIQANDKLGIRGKEPTHDYRNYVPPQLRQREKKSLLKLKRPDSKHESKRFKLRIHEKPSDSKAESRKSVANPLKAASDADHDGIDT